MRVIMLFLCAFFPLASWCQYAGGSGDGMDAAGAIQLDLGGVPGGIRGLYAGGEDDGYSSSTAFGSFSGASHHIYGGGSGDGYDHTTAMVSLNGQNLMAIYEGGPGDGYSHLQTSQDLSGFSLTGIYGGGPGDGYDHITAAASLNGDLTAGWYGGGSGDGHDKGVVSGSLGAMLMLYGGGPGDGYDKGAGSQLLNGADLGMLFGGGPGDGAALTHFEGVVPLPLTLISFDAFPEETYVLLRWVTENEANTDFFTIEKTRTGSEFEWVGEILAAGNSLPEERLNYELKDFQPYRGTSYYRLKTTDFDGLISLSHLIEVNYNSMEKWAFQLFPNPNTGSHFNIKTTGLEEEAAMLMEVFDINGRLLHTTAYTAADQQIEQVQLQKRLPAGSYLIRLVHPEHGQLSKILIVGDR